jgi:hypothetical protein
MSSEYNLFIKPSKIEDVLKNKDDKSTEYIILQNNTLVSKHIEYITELSKLKTQNDDLEEYNSTLERGKTCIQGIAKNQYILNQEKTKCIAYYKSKLTSCHIRVLKTNCFTIPLFLICFLDILFVLKASLSLVVLTIQLLHCYKQYLFHATIENDKELIYSREKIKQLDNSSETLHDLIDNY